MKELSKQTAIFSRFELQLGPEKRIHYLEVIKLYGETKYYLFNYYGWPVSDFGLIGEAINSFTKFEKNA